MKIRISTEIDGLDFIPENDLDVFNLGKAKFRDISTLYDSSLKMEYATVSRKSVLELLFENKNELYNG